MESEMKDAQSNLQALVDGLGAQEQRKRSTSQMTLGALIVALEGLPDGSEVENVGYLHSYRGYYEDLALRRLEGKRPAAELLAACKAAMGEVFEGYKGGDYVMGILTPLWISDYGTASGVKIMGLLPDGTFETAQEEW